MIKCAKCGAVGHFWAECTIKPEVPKNNALPTGKNVFEDLGFTKEESKKLAKEVDESVQKIKLKTQVERNRAWRNKNPDKYRDYMRRYMREYRARARG